MDKQNMFDKMLSLATGKNVVHALIAALTFMLVMNLGATAFFHFTHGVGLLDLAGGANLLDNRAGGYTPESAYAMVAAYGSQGIRYHLLLSLADIFFPPTLAFFLLMGILYFYAPLFRSHPLTRWLAVLSLLYLTSDYLENISIAAMLLSFPAKVTWAARMGNFMFMSKNLTSNLATAVILIGLVLWKVRRHTSKNILPSTYPNI